MCSFASSIVMRFLLFSCRQTSVLCGLTTLIFRSLACIIFLALSLVYMYECIHICKVVLLINCKSRVGVGFTEIITTQTQCGVSA